MARIMAPLDDELGPFEGDPGSFPAAASVRAPSVRRERSMKFREFGLYASKVRSQTPTSSNPSTPVLVTNSELPSPVDEEPDFDYLPSFAVSPQHSFHYPQFHRSKSPSAVTDFDATAHQYDLTSQSPPPPLSPLSPRWDSLGHSHSAIYYQASTTSAQSLSATAASYSRPSTPYDDLQRDIDSLASEIRDDFAPLTPLTSKMSSVDSRHTSGDSTLTENFSRPRKPSLKQPYPESLRIRTANTASTHSDPTELENANNQHLLWPRERGQSISSSKSATTFASLPVRPTPDLHPRDSIRGRSRQGNPSLARPILTYNRSDTNGSSFAQDRLRRMASVPSDELRSSYRSQLSTSTAQGTHLTERSSVKTKTSSIASIYGPIDDGFSVDDVMGMYEKGFRDDSPASRDYEPNDSRPPTALSERSMRQSAMLEAMSDSLPVPFASASAPEVIPKSDILVRDSAAIFRNSNLPSLSLPKEINGALEYGTKHDSAKLLDEDEDDCPARPTRPLTGMTSHTETDDDTRDRYGFRKENQYVTQEQYDSWNTGYTDYLARRRKKWIIFQKESGLMTDDPERFPPRSAKVKRFVRKGIPPEWRGAAWFYYAGGPAIVAKHAGVYDNLLRQTAKDVDNEAIERDLHRTFPDNVRFRSGKATAPSGNEQMNNHRNSQQTVKEPAGNAARPDETRMISSLRRVLHAFSVYNPRIGYCQSLNFLAGLLLLFVETEEHAFWLLNIITRVYLPGTHEMSLEGANVDLGVLMESLRDAMPAVWAKIGGELDGSENLRAKSRRGRGKKGGDLVGRLPPITLCMTAWFMSCFIGTLPIETTLRVWDVFFYEGSKTLFRIALTIFKIGENEIKCVGDPMEIFQVVQTIPRRLIDANALMEACFKRRNGFGHLSQETVEQRRDERRAGVKAERERIDAGGAAAGANDEAADVKRKNTLFGRRWEKRPAEV